MLNPRSHLYSLAVSLWHARWSWGASTSASTWTGEHQTLWTGVRSSAWTWISDRSSIYSRYRSDTNVKWIEPKIFTRLRYVPWHSRVTISSQYHLWARAQCSYMPNNIAVLLITRYYDARYLGDDPEIDLEPFGRWFVLGAPADSVRLVDSSVPLVASLVPLGRKTRRRRYLPILDLSGDHSKRTTGIAVCVRYMVHTIWVLIDWLIFV